MLKRSCEEKEYKCRSSSTISKENCRSVRSSIPTQLFNMICKKNFLATALQLLIFTSTTTAIPSISIADSAALEPRQGGYNTGIWILTFYGYPDSYSAAIDCTSAANHNPPQGSNTIAYPGCVHLGNARGKYAGGDGSYNNPLTVAAYPGKVPIPKCGVFFSPYLRKFLIFEDYCPSCTESTPHFDVWVGGGPGDKTLKGVCACENTLTPPSNKA